jgi:hypothetical protein
MKKKRKKKKKKKEEEAGSVGTVRRLAAEDTMTYFRISYKQELVTTPR